MASEGRGSPIAEPLCADHCRKKTALVLAGGGITGFLYEVGVLTALDELAGRAASNDFDVYVGTSAGALLAALLANGARPAEILEAASQDRVSSPFYFQSRDILGVSSGGPLRMTWQFAHAMLGTIGRALRAQALALGCADVRRLPGASSAGVLFDRSSGGDALRTIFVARVPSSPRRDEMELSMHSVMSFSAGHELLAYGRDCGRRFFDSSGAAILSNGTLRVE